MENNEARLKLKNAIAYVGGVLFFFAVLSAAFYGKQYSDQVAKKEAIQRELDNAIAEAKATVTYKIACIEAGKELDISDPKIEALALTIFDASKFFNSTEDEIANMAYYHSKEIKKYGINIGVKELLEEGMKAFAKPNSPFGTPTLGTFNLFGAMYQVLAKDQNS